MLIRGKHRYCVGQRVCQVSLESLVLVVGSVTKVTSSTYHVDGDGDQGRAWAADESAAFDDAYRDAWFLRCEGYELRRVASMMASLLCYEKSTRLETAKRNLRDHAAAIPVGRKPRYEIGTTHYHVL